MDSQDFPSKFFCLTVPKTFKGDPLVFHYFRVPRNFLLQRVMSRFSVAIFCLTVPKDFVEEPFCALFQKVSGTEKVYG